MKLQNLTVIFIIIILPIILLTSLYISTGTKTIKLQAVYDEGLASATYDAMNAFEYNTINNIYSDNPETKRSIIKASVKMFKTSLATSCNISTYDSKELDTYIPALVFGMYDGFYMYAPTLTKTGRYEKDLKSYVYYSETLVDGTVVRYSLDNYVSVTVKKADGTYEIKEGYLINLNDLVVSGGAVTYKGVSIKASEMINGDTNTDAIKYYNEAKDFTEWFLKIGAHSTDGADINPRPDYLKIGNTINGVVNDPEDPNSAFSIHKREVVIKNKIEAVLNSTITAYSYRTWGINYKMPKLSAEDWEKIYNNISMISFFQGKPMGLTRYNGYCVLNSTNSNEFVSPSLMYFIENDGHDDTPDYYHDIRCAQYNKDLTLTGYRVGSFDPRKEITEELKEDGDGNKYIHQDIKYSYEHKEELACYNCINGSLPDGTSVYDFIRKADTNDKIKKAYWTSLARERYNTAKVTDVKDVDTYTITYMLDSVNIFKTKTEEIGKDATIISDIPILTGFVFDGKWKDESVTPPAKYSPGEKVKFDKNTILIPEWKIETLCTVTFETDGGSSISNLQVPHGATITKPTNPTKADNNFVDWYKDSLRTQKFDFTTAITGDITLYAKWEPILYCTVTFETNGGSSISSKTVIKGEKVEEPTDPTKSGVDFVGWYEDEEYTKKFDFSAPITSNITLYAKWSPMVEYVYYDSDTETIYANISSVNNIAEVKIERPIWGVGHKRKMDKVTYTSGGKTYNYKYKFTIQLSKNESCTITVKDITGKTYKYEYKYTE